METFKAQWETAIIYENKSRGKLIAKFKRGLRVFQKTSLKWITLEKCLVAVTRKKGTTVSTIFLGVSTGTTDDGRHYLFEILVQDSKYDLYGERYATWKEAENGHKKFIKMVDGWFVSMLLTILKKGQGDL